MASLSLGYGTGSLALLRRAPRSTPALPLKVIHEGDSISAATYSFNALWAADNPAVPYQNFAVAGSILGDGTPGSGSTTSLWGRVLDVIAAAPSIVSVMVGANDDLDSDATTYFNRVMAYVAYLKAQRPGVKVLLCSNTPRDYGTGNEAQTATYNTARHGLDALYRAAVGNQIDAYASVAEHPVLTDASALGPLFDSAHLHPTSDCHANYVYPVFAPALNAVVNASTGSAPAAFAFADQVNVALSTPITGDPVIIGGMGPASAATVGVTGGTAAIGQGAFSAAPGNAMNGDAVTPRVTSSASNSTDADAVVTIGGVSDTFTATTQSAAPLAFVASSTQPTLSGSGTSRSFPLVMSEAGRPIIAWYFLADVYPTIVITDDNNGNAQVASCTSDATSNYFGYRIGLSQSDTELPAGNYTVTATASNLQAPIEFYSGYTKNSTMGAATGSGADNPSYHNAGDTLNATSVTIASGGLGLIFAFAAGGVVDPYSATLNEQYPANANGRAWALYTFPSTTVPNLNINGGQAGLAAVGLQ